MKCKRYLCLFGTFAVSAITCAVSLGVEASAETVTKTLTSEEFYNIIGDTLDFTYFDGTDYRDTTAYFDHYATINTLDSNGQYIYGIPCLLYYTDVIDPVNTNINHDTVTIRPKFYFQNISSLSFSFYCSTGYQTQYTNSIGTSWRSPSAEFYVDGTRIYRPYTWYSGSHWSQFNTSDNDLYFLQAEVAWTGDSPASYISIGDITFNGVHDFYDRIIFAVTCPTISEDAEIVFGSAPSSGSGTGTGSTNVYVDMSETNSTLSNIWQTITGIPSAIINGIKGIFVPSDEFLLEFENEIDEIKDRFAWAEEIKEIGAHLVDITENRENITAPVVVIPSIVNSKDGTVYTNSGETVLDLSEFGTEIMIVRSILSIFLWAFFIWRLYCRLPDIIHGGGMIVGDGTRIMNEIDDRQSQSLFNDMDKHNIDFMK